MPVIQTGSFTSDGTSKTLEIRSDVDYMTVWNYTQAATQQATGRGVEFRWQRGMAVDTGLEYKKDDNVDTLELVTLSSGGFTLVNSATASLGAAVTGTDITKADPPVCTAAGHGYSNGDIVQLSSLTDSEQLANVYWEIGNVTTNTFELTYMNTNTANFTAASAFTVRKLPSVSNWIPADGFVVGLSTGSTTDVILSIAAATVGFTVGQVVRLKIPSQFGSVELDGVQGEITAINTTTNAVTLDIDSSSATSFAWPAASAIPFQYPQMIPVGTNSSTSLDDRIRNVGYVGMNLAAGAQSPAGSTSDVIYWEAGKSDLVQS